MTKKTIETVPVSNYKIGEMLTVNTKSLKKKKYSFGYIVIENSQPDKLALFNIFTNEIEFVKTSANITHTEILDENINTDKLKRYDIVVFKNSISRKRMKIFFINKIHKNNTCDLIKVNCLGLTDENLILTLKNVNMRLLMHIEHAFRITHKNKYDNKSYTFQDYKFCLTNDPEKNIIVGRLEREGYSENDDKNNTAVYCSEANSNINKERVLLNRCFAYVNDPTIIMKVSTDQIKSFSNYFNESSK